MTTNLTISDSCAELFKALATAQGQMGRAYKTANNPAFRTKYSDLASILEAVLPSYNAAGIAISQHPVLDGDLVHCTTMLLHESGQWMRSVCTMPVGGKKDAHAVGSAISYVRRYTLASICGVIQADDDGNAATQQQQHEAPRPKFAPAPAPAPARTDSLTRAELIAALDGVIDYRVLESYCGWHGKAEPTAMPHHQQQQMLAWVRGPGLAVLQAYAEERDQEQRQLEQDMATAMGGEPTLPAPETRRVRRTKGGEA